MPLQLQLPRKAVLAFNAAFKARDNDLILIQAPLQRPDNDLLNPVVYRQSLTILLEYHLTMRVKYHGLKSLVQTMVMMFENPVMSKTSFTCGFMFLKTSFPPRAITLFCSMRNSRSPCDEV